MKLMPRLRSMPVVDCILGPNSSVLPIFMPFGMWWLSVSSTKRASHCSTWWFGSYNLLWSIELGKDEGVLVSGIVLRLHHGRNITKVAPGPRRKTSHVTQLAGYTSLDQPAPAVLQMSELNKCLLLYTWDSVIPLTTNPSKYALAVRVRTRCFHRWARAY